MRASKSTQFEPNGRAFARSSPAWARKTAAKPACIPRISTIRRTPSAPSTSRATCRLILGPDGTRSRRIRVPGHDPEADLWKVGQLKAGDSVRFKELSFERVSARRGAACLRGGPRAARTLSARSGSDLGRAILLDAWRPPSRPLAKRSVRTGDANLLVEYGPMVLDLTLRFRVHSAHVLVRAAGLPGVHRSDAGHSSSRFTSMRDV